MLWSTQAMDVPTIAKIGFTSEDRVRKVIALQGGDDREGEKVDRMWDCEVGASRHHRPLRMSRISSRVASIRSSRVASESSSVEASSPG